jgi:hypothetical protein
MTPPERARRTGFVRSGPGDIGRPPGELRDSPTECGVEEVDDLGEDLIELLGELVAAVLSPPGLVPGLGQVCVAGQDDREGPELNLAVGCHGCQCGCQLDPVDVVPPGQDVEVADVPPTGVGNTSPYSGDDLFRVDHGKGVAEDVPPSSLGMKRAAARV